jgi:very-short-patch-repair endonuclease
VFLCESEAIFLNGDRPQLADFYVNSAKLVFEVDGGYHLDPKQKKHDAWLLRRYGVRTVRFMNGDVLRRSAETRDRVTELLKRK